MFFLDRDGLCCRRLFLALIVVVLGSLLGEMLGVYQLLGSLWFWFGHQGWEYLDLGRGWQVLLAAGLGFWLILVIRRIATARKDPQEREISSLFLLATLATGALNALHLAG